MRESEELNSVKLYQTIGIDVGGANLKLATSSGHSLSHNYPLWKQPDTLGSAVSTLLHSLGKQLNAPPCEWLAVTMTGELADCFATRREGVARILKQLSHAVPADQIRVFAIGGEWLRLDDALDNPWHVAASNWYALATWLCNWKPTKTACEHALLLDIGSTTVDIIPIEHNRVATDARTDRDRLGLGQLVYTGLSRTPVCAVVQKLVLDGREYPVMAEFFATVDDAYIALELVDAAPTDCDSADGRPRTPDFARARLARMIGDDVESLSPACISSLAQQIVDAQANQVANAVMRNLKPQAQLVITGHGSPLAREVIRRLSTVPPVVWLSEHLDPEAVRCAPAVAAAWLWNQQIAKHEDT